MVQDFPVFIFIAGWVINAVIFVRFIIKAAALVKNIDRIYQKDGRMWPFWGSSYGLRLKFVFAPKSLLEDGDSDEIRTAKQTLVDHGKSALGLVMTMIAVQLFTVILIIPVSIIFANGH